jgi:hypothetical protein
VTNLWVEFTEAIAWKIFNGHFPQNASPELIAVAILEASPAFVGADIEVRKHFLLRMVPLIHFRKIMQNDAADADGSSEWKM